MVIVNESLSLRMMRAWKGPAGEYSASIFPAFPSVGPKTGELFTFSPPSFNSLWRMLMARDSFTSEHCRRVTLIVLLFGRFLNLPPEDLDVLEHAGLLHDVGKIGISDKILFKPSDLTPEERRSIQTHPLIGEQLVKPLNLRPAEKEIILLHHERWDGCGYPYGIARHEIPFLCRLIALADVYDALTSHRPYRPPFSRDEALAEIARQVGKQFDPELAREFLHLIKSQQLFHHRTSGPRRQNSVKLSDQQPDLTSSAPGP
ncbi:MAG: HD-GYP domain-containing protein [Deltaproteobacteria bacterium]|nr:HD-GYP domain-containing protein [Deltaproteobacteria bacterium]